MMAVSVTVSSDTNTNTNTNSVFWIFKKKTLKNVKKNVTTYSCSL